MWSSILIILCLLCGHLIDTSFIPGDDDKRELSLRTSLLNVSERVDIEKNTFFTRFQASDYGCDQENRRPVDQ